LAAQVLREAKIVVPQNEIQVLRIKTRNPAEHSGSAGFGVGELLYILYKKVDFDDATHLLKKVIKCH